MTIDPTISLLLYIYSDVSG
jgi:hypothetical protein